MKPGKDPKKTKAEEMARDSVLTGFHSGRIYRKARKSKKRIANHVERAAFREAKDIAKSDIDALGDIPSGKLSRKKIHTESSNKKEWMLHSRRRKIKAELQSKEDVYGFIVEMSKSKSLYSTIAMEFFRYFLSASSGSATQRFRSAFEKAVRNPALGKSIENKWMEFDKKFPGKGMASSRF